MPPTYEYECAACRERFEEFQSMSDPPLRKCPSCGKRRLLRLLGTGAGIIFKGSGFYETDYKRKSSPGGKEGDSGSKGESKTDAKSGSKPASGGGKADPPGKPAKKD
jgi:putative FmdB family regulatory protein